MTADQRPVLSRPHMNGHGYALKLTLAFAAIYLVWGSTYLAIRYSVETIPPLLTAAVRFLIAGGILFAWAWAHGVRTKREHWLAGAIVGMLFFLISHGALCWAEKTVASGWAALMMATEPMFILVLGSWASRQRISRLSAVGLSLGTLGIALLTGPAVTAEGSPLLGLTALLIAALAWSAGVVVSPRLSLPDDPGMRTAIPLLCGALMLLVVSSWTGEWQGVRWSAISSRSVWGLVYLILFGSVAAFTAYTWLLQRCSAGLVATHTYINPLVAVFLGWLFAAEPVPGHLIWAALAILGAIELIRRGERRAATKREQQSQANIIKHTRGPIHERV